MTKFRKSALALALLAGLVATSISALMPNVSFAQTPPEAIVPENENISLLSNNTRSFIEKPTVTWDNTSYNMVVKYTWTVGTGGDKIAVTPNYTYYVVQDSPVFTEYAWPLKGTAFTYPNYKYAKSYNSQTDEYSYNYASLEHDEDMGDHIAVMYGYKAKYSLVGELARSSAYIPTSYDKDGYIWSHGSSNGHRIKATIAYEGVYADISVKIPWIGYNTSSATIKDITFYLRTGPNKCSIKASRSNIVTGEVDFAFGID